MDEQMREQMREFEFLAMQEQTLRNKIREDYKIPEDEIITVVIFAISLNIRYEGIARFKTYEIRVYGNTLAEAMVNLCVEYGYHSEYYLNKFRG